MSSSNKEKHSNYLYGPAPSRRLGFSLGIDLVPYKTCNFDCIYCQLGRTTNKTLKRKIYAPVTRVLQQIKTALQKKERIDYLSFSGSGEPTLHSKLGYLMQKIKKITEIPIAVLTNGSLLFLPDVQKDLLGADVVLPTLCAVTQRSFKKIHRSHKQINLKRIIQGQIDFRKKYRGKIWLEVMLIKGINDSIDELRRLKKIINKIRPDKIQLNTVLRPPSEKYASPLTIKELQKIREYFGTNCEIIAEFTKAHKQAKLVSQQDAIFSLIKRRPVTASDIINGLGLEKRTVLRDLEELQKSRKIKVIKHAHKKYFEMNKIKVEKA